MNREEITKLAREAGFVGMDGDHGALRRFAALVGAAEREKVRSAMKRAFRRMAGLIRADEREACAMRAWSTVLALTDQDTADIVLRSIRERGQA